jgi:hypothetical protein
MERSLIQSAPARNFVCRADVKAFWITIADALDWRFKKYEFSMWPDAARRLRGLARGLS